MTEADWDRRYEEFDALKKQNDTDYVEDDFFYTSRVTPEQRYKMQTEDRFGVCDFCGKAGDLVTVHEFNI